MVKEYYTTNDAIYILSTGYLLINLIAPSLLDGIITQVKKAVFTINPEYDLVIKKLHFLYDMKLVTFGIDDNSESIVQCLAFVQPYSQSPLTLDQIEIVPVPVIDQNMHDDA